MLSHIVIKLIDSLEDEIEFSPNDSIQTTVVTTSKHGYTAVPTAITVSPINDDANTLSHAKPFSQKYAGFILLVLSCFVFSIMSLCVSLSAASMSSPQIAWIRFIFQAAFSYICLCYQGISPLAVPREKRMWLFLRAAVGSASLTTYYFAITHLPLGDATSLYFLSPIITGILARFLLAEPWGIVGAVASLICVGGVIFISHPSAIFGDELKPNKDILDKHLTAWDHTFGVTCALVGAVFVGFVFILIKKVGKEVPALVMIFWMAIFGLIVLPFASLITPWHLPSENITYFYLCGTGCAAFGGQFLFNTGVQLEEKAGAASVIRALDVVFAFFWQITVEQEIPNSYSVIGALLILGSVLITGNVKKR